MSTLERERTYIRKWRKLATGGDTMAMMNVAASYRLLGNRRLAYRCYRRAANLHDGEALLEVGYCYQYGAGVRRDLDKAEEAYRSAISSDYITQDGREEAQYGLAVLLLSTRPRAGRREALGLLRKANADGDYPQAADLLDAMRRNAVTELCGCRRELMRRIARHSCPIHRQRAG